MKGHRQQAINYTQALNRSQQKVIMESDIQYF